MPNSEVHSVCALFRVPHTNQSLTVNMQALISRMGLTTHEYDTVHETTGDAINNFFFPLQKGIHLNTLLVQV